jgi:hypothetical protein
MARVPPFATTRLGDTEIARRLLPFCELVNTLKPAVQTYQYYQYCDHLARLAGAKGAILAKLGERIPGALPPPELPPMVERTFSEQRNGATIRGFAADIGGGERVHIPELAIRRCGET